MHSNQKDIDQIESYLRGTLDAEATAQIGERIATDTTFAQLVEEIRRLREAAILSKKRSLLSTLKNLEKSHGKPSGKNPPEDTLLPH